jgi:hypothetical protein
MTDEGVRHLRKENAELKEELAWKDRRIEELEGRLFLSLDQITSREHTIASLFESVQ